MVLFEWLYFLRTLCNCHGKPPPSFPCHSLPQKPLAFWGQLFLCWCWFHCDGHAHSPRLCLSQVWILAAVHSRQRQLTRSLQKRVFRLAKAVLCQGKVVQAFLNSGSKTRNVTPQGIKLWLQMILLCDLMEGYGLGFCLSEMTVETLVYLWKYLHQSQVLFCSCCFLGLRLNWHLSEPQISVYSCSQ